MVLRDEIFVRSGLKSPLSHESDEKRAYVGLRAQSSAAVRQTDTNKVGWSVCYYSNGQSRRASKRMIPSEAEIYNHCFNRMTLAEER